MKIAFTLLVSLLTSRGALILTGVFDGPLTGGLPKGIEVYASTDIADLSSYGMGSANNGGGSDGNEFTFSGSATAGEYLYVTFDQAGFNAFFGFNANYVSAAANINGNDAIELYSGGMVVDTFGDPNTDGEGEAWEYTNGWAYRKSGTRAGAYNGLDWNYSGIKALNAHSSNAVGPAPIPTGTYAIPEPTTLVLVGLSTLGLFARRRH